MCFDLYSQYRVGGNSFWNRGCCRFRSPRAIDQFGLLGAPQISLTPVRILGLILMAAGVFFVVRK